MWYKVSLSTQSGWLIVARKFFFCKVIIKSMFPLYGETFYMLRYPGIEVNAGKEFAKTHSKSICCTNFPSSRIGRRKFHNTHIIPVLSVRQQPTVCRIWYLCPEHTTVVTEAVSTIKILMEWNRRRFTLKSRR